MDDLGVPLFSETSICQISNIIPSNLVLWWGQFLGVWILNEGKQVRHAWTDVIFLVNQESSFFFKYNLRHVDEGRFGYIIGTPF